MKTTNSAKKKQTVFNVCFILILAVIALLLFFLFKDIILEILRLTKSDDKDGIKEFMASKGWLGYFSVVAVEALEMIVVCIPAEFIQMPAGISFPVFTAILLCDAGVVIGASIIYVLVKTFKVKPPLLEKKEKKIESIEKTSGGVKTQVLMYFLFVTPIIPFGAICYYCSNKKIGYGKYVFTCATGVLPSIVTSIIMGAGVRYCLTESIPIWKLVLLIFALGACLFIGMFLIWRKFLCKKENKNTPNSIVYKPLMAVFGLFTKLHSKANYREDGLYEELLDVEGPVVFLCNHQSVYDIYHTMKFIYPIRPALVGNRYYLRNKVTRFAIRSLGFIPKRLFTSEVEPIVKIIGNIKKGTSVFIYPEARLSLDGTANPIVEGTGSLIKKLCVPTVILNVSGDFAAYSKIHTAAGRVPVEVKVNRILYPEEIRNLDKDELNAVIQKGIETDEYGYLKNFTLKNKNLASGSAKVIYKCPKCKRDFAPKSAGNKLYCDCGFEVEFDEHYGFKPNGYGFADLSEAYRFVKSLEKEEVISDENDVKYSVDVTVKVLNFDSPKKDLTGEGTVSVTARGVGFSGTVNGEEQTFSKTFSEVPCLAFGVDDEFEFYHQNRLYYFYPKGNKRACTKISTVYDILRESNRNLL